MKRKDATQRLEELLANVTARGRHANMVEEIWLFGSYARGALMPGDVDLEIVITPDEQYREEEVRAFFGHRHPSIDFLRELRGRRRGLEIGIGRTSEIDFPEKTLLYRRGDDLELAMERLHAIQADLGAVRAPRDPVVPQLDGLDKELTRSERAELSALCSEGWIELERLTLGDAGSTQEAEVAMQRLYADKSPLGRVALAALSELNRRGITAPMVEVSDVVLGNRWAFRKKHSDPARLAVPTHAIGWLRVVEDGLGFMAFAEGEEYWHVLKPMKKGPIEVLLLRKGPKLPDNGLEEFRMRTPGARHEILPELLNWVHPA